MEKIKEKAAVKKMKNETSYNWFPPKRGQIKKKIFENLADMVETAVSTVTSKVAGTGDQTSNINLTKIDREQNEEEEGDNTSFEKVMISGSAAMKPGGKNLINTYKSQKINPL